MNQSSGAVLFPKTYPNSALHWFWIFKDYNICHFEKCKYIILKNPKPRTWYGPICVYVFVKRASPPPEAESNPENYMIFISAQFVARSRQRTLFFRMGSNSLSTCVLFLRIKQVSEVHIISVQLILKN